MKFDHTKKTLFEALNMSEKEIKALSKKLVKAINANTVIEKEGTTHCLSKVAEASLELLTKKEKQFIVCDWVIERAESAVKARKQAGLSSIFEFLGKLQDMKKASQN